MISVQTVFSWLIFSKVFPISHIFCLEHLACKLFDFDWFDRATSPPPPFFLYDLFFKKYFY